MRTEKEINDIIKAHENGLSYGEISKKFNVNKSSVAFYCNRNRSSNIVERAKQKIEQDKEYEEIICQLIKESDNIHQVCKKLNKRPTNNNYKKIQDVINKYKLDISHFTLENSFSGRKVSFTDEEVFSNRGKFYNLGHLKKRLFDGGYKPYQCERCGLTEWQGESISLQIHHINGDRCDNRLENLQVLCPNCHSQTDSYCVGKHDRSTLLEKLQKQRKEEKTRKCLNCEKEFYRKDDGQFCSYECAKEYNSVHISKKDIIATVVKHYGNITRAAQEFDMSDNGFRKKLKKENLPYHSNELKEMIDNGTLT